MVVQDTLQGGIVFTGGGTAGHVFPGIAVMQSLPSDVPVAWIGGIGGIERSLVGAAGIPFYGIHGGKLRRYFSLKNITDVLFIKLGFLQAWWLLRKIRPRVVFSKGGYISVPVVMMAFLLGIPVISHESDLLPGLATRINLRFSQLLYTSWSATRRYVFQKYQHQVRYVGNPVRRMFRTKSTHMSSSRPHILILGGSLGSRQINQLVAAILDPLLEQCSVVHQYGNIDPLPAARTGYQVFSFLEEKLSEYLQKADLIISRAGAGMLSEIAFLGKAAILIPLTGSASRGEQRNNAQMFVDARAALMLLEPGPQELLKAIRSVIDSPTKQSEMENASRDLATPDAAHRVADNLAMWRKRALV